MGGTYLPKIYLSTPDGGMWPQGTLPETKSTNSNKQANKQQTTTTTKQQQQQNGAVGLGGPFT